jgi:hypothetical protein
MGTNDAGLEGSAQNMLPRFDFLTLTGYCHFPWKRVKEAGLLAKLGDMPDAGNFQGVQ